jgi:hypothetical protein
MRRRPAFLLPFAAHLLPLAVLVTSNPVLLKASGVKLFT